MDDVEAEFDENRKRCGIKKYLSKTVNRKYAFDLENVPAEAEYLKVVYSYSEPALSNQYLQGKTYSMVFGTNTNPLELFMLKRKLMGPCWVEIRDFQAIESGKGVSLKLEIKNQKLISFQLSWCRVELSLTDPKKLKVLEDIQTMPPLTIATINMRTVMNHEKKINEIVCANVLVYTCK